MSLTLGIAIYFIVWWTVLFAVLPFGVRTQGEAGDVVPGTPESAPVRPLFLRIVARTTLVASLVFAVIYLAMTNREATCRLLRVAGIGLCG